jgi:MSHA biogenesis protein MshQ
LHLIKHEEGAMRKAWLRSLSLCSALAAMLLPGTALGDTPVTLFKTFTGNINFAGGEKTMRGGANDCTMVSSSKDLVVKVGGIPGGSTVVSAQLYWAGSNIQTGSDDSVTFAGTTVTAPLERQYFSPTIGSGYDYFGAAADVTALVKGNGDYHVHGLTASNTAPWCKGQGVLGGYALVVVYTNPNEPFRVLNLYEGFEYLRNSSLTLTANNFKIPASPSDGHIGHVLWSGDAALKPGELVAFNGSEMADKTNPSGNQFNSASSISGAGDMGSFGIDFDDYTISSCSCQAGQTDATLLLQTAQDMVLVQSAVIAMPSMPTADLKLVMTRRAELQVGADTSYSLSVSSAGPDTESGPVTLTDALPAGLQYVGASGANWSCSLSGQAVTCTNPGPLASGSTLAPLTLTVRASASGTFTNSASVSGMMYDYVASNNSASDTASTPGAFVFTDAACVPGKAFGAAGQSCRRYTGPATAGAAAAIYVTAIDATLTPVALNAAAPTTAQARFALSCVNPPRPQGIAASYNGAALPLCAQNGTVPDPAGAGWSQAVTLSFAANSPSAQLTAGFLYQDVGQVVFSLADAANRVSSVAFVVKPALLVFSSITRSRDGAPNPAPTDGSGPGFVRAGEAFTLAVAAQGASGALAPNFGNEGAQVALAQQQQGALPAVRGAFDTLSGGVFSGAAFAWDEAGIVVLTPQLAGGDYLGAGVVAGQAVNVGRFYPDHFETAVSAAFPCQPRMACPSGTNAAGALLDPSGAVYSGQAFEVTVRPIGAAGNTLTNYSGAYARPITLWALDAPGGTPFNPGGGSLGANSIGAIAPGQQASAHPVYQLPTPFDPGAPRALNWSAPTPVYLRATSSETIAAPGGGTQSATVSSQRAAGSVEGGIDVVAGRLYLGNVFGSELLPLPLALVAQYWTGSFWDANGGDNASAVASGAWFTGCLKHLADGSAGASNCKPALALAGATPRVLGGGRATAWLRAPGSGNDGSGFVRIDNSAAPWLPSVIARAVFGVYKSHLIYVREMY